MSIDRHPNPNFTVKDSGQRESFASGMVRDTAKDKIDYTRVIDGPMLKRWATFREAALVSELIIPDPKEQAFKKIIDWYNGKEIDPAEIFQAISQAEGEQFTCDRWLPVFSPMLDRWARHLTLGEKKYPDYEPGKANWLLAKGEAEYIRFRKSAVRHAIQWLHGETDEDHASAIYFNINGAEYVKAQRKSDTEDEGLIL